VHWQWIAVGYVAYLAVVSLARPEFARARRRVLTGCAAVGVLAVADLRYSPLGTPGTVIVPALVLLAGYRLSGLLFVRIDFRVEAWLLESDATTLGRTGILARFQRAPRAVSEYFELCYLLVYSALPIGATLLAVSGQAGAVNRYWTAVLLSEFLCFAVLPWVQTRPPMILEAPASSTINPGPFRRFNQFIAARASIRASTIPSGHAAGALASALGVGAVMPAAGAAFLVLALSITTASVLGRYHYALDSVLGLLVALIAWSVI